MKEIKKRPYCGKYNIISEIGDFQSFWCDYCDLHITVGKRKSLSEVMDKIAEKKIVYKRKEIPDNY